MGEQCSYLDKLPVELKPLIFEKIDSPTAMFRLLAVNRSIAQSTRELSFPNIQRISLHVASGGSDGGQNLINGEEVKPKNLVNAIKQIWKEATEFNSLQVTGKMLDFGWLNGDQMMFQVIKDLMVKFPRALKELQLNVNIPSIWGDEGLLSQDYSSGRFCIEGVEDIIAPITGSVEKIELSVQGSSHHLLAKLSSFEALGNCLNLKEFALNDIWFNFQNIKTLCLNKHLSSIIFQQKHRSDHEELTCVDTLYGVLLGLDLNITSLNLGAPKLSFNQIPLVKNFPFLTTFTVTVQPHDNPIYSFQSQYYKLFQIFPALEYLVFKNETPLRHLGRDGMSTCWSINFFLDTIQNTLPTNVTERKLRVKIEVYFDFDSY